MIFALTGAGANPRADGGYVHGDRPAADGVPEALRGHQGPPGHPQATVFFLDTHSLGPHTGVSPMNIVEQNISEAAMSIMLKIYVFQEREDEAEDDNERAVV